MKVLHIAPTPFFADRGCYIRIRNEIEALRQDGIEVVLCTYHHGHDVDGIKARRSLRIPGYTKLDAGFSPYRFLADMLLFFLVLKTAWQEKPALLHGHLHEGVLIGWAVKWCLFWRRLPLVMDMQGSLSGELIGYGTISRQGVLARLVLLAEKLICRMPDFFFCSSQRSCGLLHDTFGIPQEQIMLLADVVPDGFFQDGRRQEARARLGITGQRTVVLYTGSLMSGKGVHHLLQAAQELHQHQPDLYFLLVGYPVEPIQREVAAMGLEDVIHLVGQVAYEDLPSWLAAADIAVDPKEEVSGEASGKILHYMAAGLPVVCFATSNNHSLLGEHGYYAQGAGRQTLAQAIQKAAAETSQQRTGRGREGQAVIRKRYSFAMLRGLMGRQYRKWTARTALGANCESLMDMLPDQVDNLMISSSSLADLGNCILACLA